MRKETEMRRVRKKASTGWELALVLVLVLVSRWKMEVVAVVATR